MELNDNILESIIKKTLTKVIKEDAFRPFTEDYFRNFKDKAKEFVTGREQLYDEPQTASQLLSADGWTGTTLEKLPNGLIIRCYTKNSSGASQVLDFEELVDDLNYYYQKRNLPIQAKGMMEYKGEEGTFLQVTKQ